MSKLKKFVNRNRCYIQPLKFKQHLKWLDIKNPKVKQCSYVTISCRERDLNKDSSGVIFMRKYINKVLFITLLCPLTSVLAEDFTYSSMDNHGYMEVSMNSSHMKVNISVGAGSCGGDVFVNKKINYKNNLVVIPRKQGCYTVVKFKDEFAFVEDTCISLEDDASSTCAVLGKYIVN